MSPSPAHGHSRAACHRPPARRVPPRVSPYPPVPPGPPLSSPPLPMHGDSGGARHRRGAAVPGRPGARWLLGEGVGGGGGGRSPLPTGAPPSDGAGSDRKSPGGAARPQPQPQPGACLPWPASPPERRREGRWGGGSVPTAGVPGRGRLPQSLPPPAPPVLPQKVRRGPGPPLPPGAVGAGGQREETPEFGGGGCGPARCGNENETMLEGSQPARCLPGRLRCCQLRRASAKSPPPGEPRIVCAPAPRCSGERAARPPGHGALGSEWGTCCGVWLLPP